MMIFRKIEKKYRARESRMSRNREVIERGTLYDSSQITNLIQIMK